MNFACIPCARRLNRIITGFLVLADLLSGETVLTGLKLALLHGGAVLGLRRLIEEQRVTQGAPTVLEPRALRDPLSVRGFPIWASDESAASSSLEAGSSDKATSRTQDFLKQSIRAQAEATRYAAV